jgi:hypothetical protein
MARPIPAEKASLTLYLLMIVIKKDIERKVKKNFAESQLQNEPKR